MRILQMLIFSTLLFFTSQVAMAGVDPSSATWTLYKVYLYESADCTGAPQVVLDDTTGVSEDFVNNPTMSSVSNVDSGTYNCVAIKISDEVTFVPSADSGSECVSGTSYTISVCQSSQTSQDADTGASTTCTDGADTVWVYLSTWASTAQSMDTFTPPSTQGESSGINLGSALTVSEDGTTTGTFIIDTTGTVDTAATGADGADVCDMAQPTFSFSSTTE